MISYGCLRNMISSWNQFWWWSKDFVQMAVESCKTFILDGAVGVAFFVYYYFYLIVLFAMVIIISYFRFKYPFWSIQPIYHTYDWFRYLAVNFWMTSPQKIRQKFVRDSGLGSKYLNGANIVTMPFGEVSGSDEILDSVVDLLQCHYNRQPDILYTLSKTDLNTRVVASSSYISVYRDPLNGSILGCMTSKSVQMYYLGSKIDEPVFFWDHICVHRDQFGRDQKNRFLKSNVTRNLIQTHQYNQDLGQRTATVSIFHKEGSLCEGVVPLVEYVVSVFQLYAIRPPKMPPHIVVTKLNSREMVELMRSGSGPGSIQIFPEIANLAECVKQSLLYIYAIKRRDEILGIYVLRDTKTIYDIASYDEGEPGGRGTIEFAWSLNVGCTNDVFFAGFLETLYQILGYGGQKGTSFQYARFTDLGHNAIILEKWRQKYTPLAVTTAAYYIYNMVVPKMPLDRNECFLIM